MLSIPELAPLLYFVIWSTRIFWKNILCLRLCDAAIFAFFVATIAGALFLSHFLWRDRVKSGLFVTLASLAFFGYGSVFESLGLYLRNSISTGALHAALLAGISSFLCIAALILKRATFNLENFVRILNIYLLIFAVLTGYEQGLAHANIPERLTTRAEIPPRSSAARLDSSILPDVYYFVFDAFGREDILRDLYDIDTASFTGFLRGKGFYVADRSTTNYPSTFASVVSTLECRYIGDLLAPTLYPDDFVGRLRENPTAEAFSRQGYRIVTFKSGYYYTNASPDGGLKTDQFQGLGEFSGILLGRTMLPGIMAVAPARLVNAFPPWLREFCSPYIGLRDRIRYVFDEVPRLSTGNEPVFSFAHVVSPHGPFVFDEYGRDVEPPYCFAYSDANDFRTVFSEKEYKLAYAAQIRHMQDRIRNLVTSLQAAHRSRPLVIILSSDHGPGCHLNYGILEGSNLKERFSNLIAVYFSDQDYSQMRPTMTPVNLFRIIRSRYLAENLPLLEDRNYFISGLTPFPPIASETSSIVDVTEMVQ